MLKIEIEPIRGLRMPKIVFKGNTPSYVQGSSDAKFRHQTYRISSPARDFGNVNEKRAQGSTGIEPGPPAWQSSALTTHLSQLGWQKCLNCGYIKLRQNCPNFILDMGCLLHKDFIIASFIEGSNESPSQMSFNHIFDYKISKINRIPE